MPAWLRAKTEPPIIEEKTWTDFAEFSAYREKVGGTFAQILQKNNCEPDWGDLTPEAKEYFA
jgi:hypothetical protein